MSTGFDNAQFVLIRTNYWKTNEALRPILLQAWFSQFADIIKTEVILKLGKKNYANINSFGAFDIVLHVTPGQFFETYFCMATYKVLFKDVLLPPKEISSKIEEMKNIICAVKSCRNQGTHKSTTPDLLKQILKNMSEFCKKLKSARAQEFTGDCEAELKSMAENPAIY